MRGLGANDPSGGVVLPAEIRSSRIASNDEDHLNFMSAKTPYDPLPPNQTFSPNVNRLNMGSARKISLRKDKRKQNSGAGFSLKKSASKAKHQMS